MDLPPEGTRIGLAGCLGTVRFVGNVDNTSGIWLGIEWDDPKRGKHNGVKDGKRYFDCRLPSAGSFIRPSINISFGRSFLEALTSKYIEAPHGSQSQENVILGSSHGTIVVEAVRLDKIRRNLANLERLREVSLNNENLARCDSPGAIRDVCPNIRGLDLSMSLLSSWDDVAKIASELPVLQRLALNHNRFQPAGNTSIMGTAFLNLTELQLNGTMITWPEMQTATAFMPKLRAIEMGYNGLSHLSLSGHPDNTTVQVINLDSNICSNWGHVFESLGHYTCLQRVILTSNCIGTIPFLEHTQQQSYTLKHLSLSFNKLTAWTDLDGLSSWCPNLETLTLSGNPLMDHELARHSRPFIISRIPSLLILDGAIITPKERADCEIFYLSHVMQFGPGSEDGRRQEHPQWLNLCAKHGRPSDNLSKGVPPDKLSNRLIVLNCYQSSTPPPHVPEIVQTLLKTSEPIMLRVLPKMALRTLRMKVRKAMGNNKAAILLGLRMYDGALVDLGIDQDLENVDRLGLQDGSDIVFHIMQK